MYYLLFLVVDQGGPAHEGQHDLAAVAVFGPVVLLVQGLEVLEVEKLEHFALDLPFLTCT